MRFIIKSIDHLAAPADEVLGRIIRGAWLSTSRVSRT